MPVVPKICLKMGLKEQLFASALKLTNPQEVDDANLDKGFAEKKVDEKHIVVEIPAIAAEMEVFSNEALNLIEPEVKTFTKIETDGVSDADILKEINEILPVLREEIILVRKQRSELMKKKEEFEKAIPTSGQRDVYARRTKGIAVWIRILDNAKNKLEGNKSREQMEASVKGINTVIEKFEELKGLGEFSMGIEIASL